MRPKHIITILALVAVLLIGLPAPTFAQLNSVVQTSLSSAITASQTQITVASATGISAPSYSTGTAGSALFVVDVGQVRGELMNVVAVSGTTITVSRTSGPTTAHASGAMVLVATAPNWFYTYDPTGTCTASTVYASPWVNVMNGRQWLCSAKTGTWVAGWGNDAASPQVLSATATASVAGATAIAGPVVEISGTNAITSFTMSVGWNGQNFCIVPTGAFTTVAGNNIAKASLAVASQRMCLSYDANTSKFAANY